MDETQLYPEVLECITGNTLPTYVLSTLHIGGYTSSTVLQHIQDYEIRICICYSKKHSASEIVNVVWWYAVVNMPVCVKYFYFVVLDK